MTFRVSDLMLAGLVGAKKPEKAPGKKKKHRGPGPCGHCSICSVLTGCTHCTHCTHCTICTCTRCTCTRCTLTGVSTCTGQTDFDRCTCEASFDRNLVTLQAALRERLLANEKVA
jgi:hypothetical protein